MNDETPLAQRSLTDGADAPAPDPALADYAADAERWFEENTPGDPGFLLPLSFLEVGTDEQFSFLRDWQQKVYEAGYLGANWPEAYGGRGLPQAYQDAATAAMRRARAPIMLNAIGLNWAGPLLLDMGTEEDRLTHLRPILSGESIWCQGFSEPDHGSDLGSAQLRAVRDGDEYVLNGSKIWTTLGNYADHMILLARTSNDAPSRYAGLSFFLISMRTPGIETVPIRKLTGEYGFTQTFFTDVRVPAAALMGEEGQGWLIAMRTLEYERGARGGQPGGYSMTGFDMDDVVALARRTMRGGRPAIEDPAIHDELTALMIEAEGLRLNKRREAITPLTADHPMALPLGSKLLWSELAHRVGDLAMRITGADAGYYVGDEKAPDGGLWTRTYLNSFAATIGGGTSEVQRNIVGEHVLGLPKG